MSMRGAMISRAVVSSISMMPRIIWRSSSSMGSPSVSISARRRSSSRLVLLLRPRGDLDDGREAAVDRRRRRAEDRAEEADERGTRRMPQRSGVARDDQARQRVEHGDDDSVSRRRRRRARPTYGRARASRRRCRARSPSTTARLRTTASAPSVDARSLDVAEQRVLRGGRPCRRARAGAARLADATAASAAATMTSSDQRQREDDDAQHAIAVQGRPPRWRPRRPARGCARARRCAIMPSGTSRVTTEPALVRAPRPMFTGATSIVSLPMKAPSPIVVRCLFAPS